MLKSLVLVMMSAATPPESTATGPDDLTPRASSQSKVIDILLKPAVSECAAQAADEIVVCAQKTDQERYRLRSQSTDSPFAREALKAEFSLSESTTMLAEGEAAGLPQGVQSNRLMVRMKIKF